MTALTAQVEAEESFPSNPHADTLQPATAEARADSTSAMGTLPAPYNSADPIEHCVVAEAPELPTVVVKAKDIASYDLTRVIDAAYSTLATVIEEAGSSITGPAFVLHHRRPVDTADMEVGFPVSSPLTEPVACTDDLEAVPSVLPGGKVAMISHMGSYGELAEAWGAFVEAIGDAKERMTYPFWEFYVSVPTPDADPTSLRTDLVTRLED